MEALRLSRFVTIHGRSSIAGRNETGETDETNETLFSTLQPRSRKLGDGKAAPPNKIPSELREYGGRSLAPVPIQRESASGDWRAGKRVRPTIAASCRTQRDGSGLLIF
jgi:hypothetical protein